MYRNLLPDWLSTFIDLEDAASRIRTYEVQLIPGLLQTEDYARAVISRGRLNATDAEIERRVALRMHRTRILTRSDAPRLWVVVDESALYRSIGRRGILQGQLRHLVETTELPRVTLQIAPFAAGIHAGEAGAFSILRFPQPDLPDMVYVEQLSHGLCLDARAEVDAYSQVMERLCAQAEPPKRSRDLLHRILSEM